MLRPKARGWRRGCLRRAARKWDPRQGDVARLGGGAPATGPEGRGKRWRTRRGEDGFTLIELLVVMVILGLLVAMVGPRLFGKVGQSKLGAAQAQIELFGTALDAFRLDVGRYPTTAEGLQSLQEKPAGAENWAGPYLRKQIPLDPWGKSYLYKAPGDNGEYDLISYGADGQAGGEGENQDVVSWKGLGAK